MEYNGETANKYGILKTDIFANRPILSGLTMCRFKTKTVKVIGSNPFFFAF